MATDYKLIVNGETWHIQYNPKPIPERGHDWDWFHNEYDGAPDSGDERAGTAESVPKAVEAIIELLEQT